MTYEAIDNYNKEQILRGILRTSACECLPSCSTVRTLVNGLIIKTPTVGAPYLDNFTYDLFLPDHLRTFRGNLTFNSLEPEHSSKPKDKRDDNENHCYCEENPEERNHRYHRLNHSCFHTTNSYTGDI
jgi:hypothetical protein